MLRNCSKFCLNCDENANDSLIGFTFKDKVPESFEKSVLSVFEN